MRRQGSLAVLAAIALLFGGIDVRVPFGAPVAQAAQTWQVQAGGDLAPGLSGINYYPRTLTINAGDTVSFSFPSLDPHTVTFDAGQVPGLFLTGLIPNSPEPGDLDGTKAFLALNVTGPSPSYDGSQALSSGVPLDPPDERMPFQVTFPKAGAYHYECAVHGPGMAGDLFVLPSGSAPAETPAQATARGALQARAEVTNTMAFANALGITPQRTAGPNGMTIHTLSAGASGFYSSLMNFLPASYTVKRGDYITWGQPDINELHTVTFLSGEMPPPFLRIVPQPGGEPRVVIPAATNAPSGGTVYTGTGIVNSGSLTGGNSFTLRIDAPAGSYEYVCLFHKDSFKMIGTITVIQ